MRLYLALAYFELLNFPTQRGWKRIYETDTLGNLEVRDPAFAEISHLFARRGFTRFQLDPSQDRLAEPLIRQARNVYFGTLGCV